MLTVPFAVLAEGLRIATFHAELTRKGPGLLLRDIARGEDAQIAAITDILNEVRPDVLLLTKVDVDAGGQTLAVLKETFGFAHGVAKMPNSARFIDGTRAAWARFAGSGGMVLLSQRPIDAVQHFNDVLWRDLPGAELPVGADGAPFYSGEMLDALPVVTQGLWQVQMGDLSFILFQNTTPVFDGPEDSNGKRSRDQLRLVAQVVDGLEGQFVVMGNSNLDPNAGDGDRAAMRAFLDRPDLQDLRPSSDLGGLSTAFWDKPGPMRVSYILPGSDLTVQSAEVFWPAEGPLRNAAEQASRHRLVWMDIRP